MMNTNFYKPQRCFMLPRQTVHDVSLSLFDSGLNESQVLDHVAWLDRTQVATLERLGVVAAAKKETRRER